MVELKDTNSLNHFSLFFSHCLPPQIFCILHTVGKDICFPFLPSLSAHLHQGAWGAVVHHCHFCWQSLQDKLRAAALPTASGSGNLCATNCWSHGRVFWRSVTALSYFTFSFYHPVWLLAETRYGAPLAELLCLLCFSPHFKRLLVYLILHRVMNKGIDHPGHQHIQGYVFMKNMLFACPPRPSL